MGVGFTAAHAGEMLDGKQYAAVPQPAAGLFPERRNLLRCCSVGASVHAAADVQYGGKVKVEAQLPDVFSGIVRVFIGVFWFAGGTDFRGGRSHIGMLFHPGNQAAFLVHRKEKGKAAAIELQI